MIFRRHDHPPIWGIHFILNHSQMLVTDLFQDGLEKYITDALRKSEQKLQDRAGTQVGEFLGRLREAMLGYEFHVVIRG